MKIKKRLDVLLVEQGYADSRAKAQAIIMSGQVYVDGNNRIRELAVCDKFSAKLLSLNGKYTISYKDSFISLIVLEGNAAISCKNNTLNITKGDSVFIPAGLEVELSGAADILYSYV